MQTTHEATLEGIIDSIGLQRTVELMSEICSGKAEHVRTNWQDRALARTWERASTYLQRMADVPAIAEAGGN